MDDDKLRKHMKHLLDQYKKQDNPMILREISLTAYKLMKAEKDQMILCPECMEPGQIASMKWAVAGKIEIFATPSKLACENKHEWRHDWCVGDKILHSEPINQYYIYQYTGSPRPTVYEFKLINGERHFPSSPWSNYETL